MRRTNRKAKKVAIIGGGPSGLFIYKKLISGKRKFEIDIFEAHDRLGEGMPYSTSGANDEHVTNVSANEIPHIVTSFKTWLRSAPRELLAKYAVSAEKYNEYQVFPRLLFGEYLSAQFDLLLKRAERNGIVTNIHMNTCVQDLQQEAGKRKIVVVDQQQRSRPYDVVIICTGHKWPSENEKQFPDYFDSPYPPSKIKKRYNHPVALKGSSLTAIDAVRTLARMHGQFKKQKNGRLSFRLHRGNNAFRIVMHSINGLLPAIRFHMSDNHLPQKLMLTNGELQKHIRDNDGFLSLDSFFEKKFKLPLQRKDPEFYGLIEDMQVEEFVEWIMTFREDMEPFELFKAEYAEAEHSIDRGQSVHWKEVLAALSFAMNYPAKHFSAEDMLRLKRELMPLISVVIAFIPQSSADELIALYDAGILSIVSVDKESTVTPDKRGGATYKYRNANGTTVSKKYKAFIDCTGQPPVSFDEFPFAGLRSGGAVSAARLCFRTAEAAKKERNGGNNDVEVINGEYYLKVPGLRINDNFQAVDARDKINRKLFIMAPPFIGGYNPDYSGLDFSNQASDFIMDAITARPRRKK